MPPDLTKLTSSNYLCLELIFMVPKVFEPLKLYCILLLLKRINIYENESRLIQRLDVDSAESRLFQGWLNSMCPVCYFNKRLCHMKL